MKMFFEFYDRTLMKNVESMKENKNMVNNFLIKKFRLFIDSEQINKKCFLKLIQNFKKMNLVNFK
jgi:hypothetical protein